MAGVLTATLLRAIGQGLAVGVVAAAVSWYRLTARGVGAALVAFCALIFCARALVQGCCVDRPYRGTADLRGRVAVITGGSLGGLGWAGAELLAQLGATIMLTVRTDAKGREAVEKLKQSAGHDRISYVLTDFRSLASVAAGAKAILQRIDRLDFLVLNAGICRGRSDEVWMTNLVGPFHFTELLRPLLEMSAKRTGDVRVIAVSSGVHKRATICFESPYDPPHGSTFSRPYGQSKLAQIMHMRELQRRMRASSPELAGETAVRCIAVNPGFALTNIAHLHDVAKVWMLARLVARSAWMGAQVIKMACIDQDIPGGSYLSNCLAKPTEGANGCSNDPVQWVKLWELCAECVKKARFP